MKLVVKQDRPLRRVLITALGLAAVAILIGFAFHFGQWRSIVSSMAVNSTRRDTQSLNRELQRENDELRRELTHLKSVREIDQNARKASYEQIRELEGIIVELRKDLTFYEELMTSNEGASGPKVEGLKFIPVDDQGRYNYRLVLTNVAKNGKVADGQVEVKFTGNGQHGRTLIRLADAVETGGDALNFSFKHFCRIEGTMKVPPDFKPEQVQVLVLQPHHKYASFDETYNWAKLVN